MVFTDIFSQFCESTYFRQEHSVLWFILVGIGSNDLFTKIHVFRMEPQSLSANTGCV